jgi:CheY-like chemotaxis protein
MKSKPVVLLVEDEPLLSEMTKNDLEDLGFSTVCAKDAAEALETLQGEARAGVLITDIRMPGEFDGWELARRARALRPDLLVIYISGYSADAPQPVVGSVFLKKPYRLRDVEDALARLGIA